MNKNKNDNIQLFEERAIGILDAEYEPTDIAILIPPELNPEQQKDLKNLLTGYSDIFNGSLGKLNAAPYKIPIGPIENHTILNHTKFQ